MTRGSARPTALCYRTPSRSILIAALGLVACSNRATSASVSSTSDTPATATATATATGFDLGAFVKETYPRCKKPVVCGNLAYVDCNAAADGPLYYLDARNGARVSTCGGACRGPAIGADGGESEGHRMCRTMCPPPEWTCR